MNWTGLVIQRYQQPIPNLDIISIALTLFSNSEATVLSTEAFPAKKGSDVDGAVGSVADCDCDLLFLPILFGDE